MLQFGDIYTSRSYLQSDIVASECFHAVDEFFVSRRGLAEVCRGRVMGKGVLVAIRINSSTRSNSIAERTQIKKKPVVSRIYQKLQ